MHSSNKFSLQTYLILSGVAILLILGITIFHLYQKNNPVEEVYDESIVITPEAINPDSLSFLKESLSSEEFDAVYSKIDTLYASNYNSSPNPFSYVENSFSVESSNPLKASFKITSDANLNFRIILDKTSETLKITTKQIP